MFKNPIPYLIARETDIMVTGDCHNHDDSAPQERFSPVNNNIGFVYFRWGRSVGTLLRDRVARHGLLGMGQHGTSALLHSLH